MRATTLVAILAVLLACGRGPRGDSPTSSGGIPDEGGAGSVAPPTPPEPSPPAGPPAVPPPPAPPQCPTDATTAPPPIDAGVFPDLASTGAAAPPSNAEACAGIDAPRDVAMRQFATLGTSLHCHSICMPAAGNAAGVLALPQEHYDSNCHGAGIHFVTTSGALLGSSGGASLGLSVTTFQQPSGLLTSGRSYLGPPARPATITAWNPVGRFTGSASLFVRERPAGELAVHGPDPGYFAASESDPGGGVLFAGDLRVVADAPFGHAAVMLGDRGTGPEVRWGPVPLDSDGVVLGVGVDVFGRSLVLTDGAGRFGAGTVAAQWFERDGSRLTCAFALLDRYVAEDDRAWLEASPLVGGGIAVHRVDGTYAPRLTVRSRALAVVESGAASFSPAPVWMRARPDAILRIVRGGRAYAVLPRAGAVGPCSQRVEVLAPDGTSCGAREFAIADGECTTRAIMVAADGTVIQQLPEAMERYHEDYGNGCTWRWWEGALR